MNAFNSSLSPSYDDTTTLLPGGRARRDAERSAIRTLLNCYLREVAIPGGTLITSPGAHILQTLPLGWRQKQRSQRWLLIDLQHSRQQLMVAVSRHTLLGNYRYAYPVLGRSTAGDGAAWAELDAMQMTTWLVADLCDAEGMPFNLEFTQQIKLSLENTANILAHRLQHPPGTDAPQDLYLFSEQSLAFGHAFHPTPKSRQWHADGAEAGYAPEYRSYFQLHWFKVPRTLLRCETVEPLSPTQLLADIAPADIWTADDECLIPVHPEQAQYVLSLPVTRRAVESGTLEYLGSAGDEYAATASVRTLYNRDTPWFIKGSLNVRITNCVRKNAIYELETALALNSRLTEIKADLQSQHQGFRLLEEPGFMTVQLPGLDSADNTLIQEGFGVVFRENINRVLSDGEQAVMAGALFRKVTRYGTPSAFPTRHFGYSTMLRQLSCRCCMLSLHTG
ncbi:IucA/IucC family protein [Aliamphritea spongicola]|nr:IucA/IucC family protein [Aliamphritea spongicola]